MNGGGKRGLDFGQELNNILAGSKIYKLGLPLGRRLNLMKGGFYEGLF
jgi:hypothetical protein